MFELHLGGSGGHDTPAGLDLDAGRTARQRRHAVATAVGVDLSAEAIRAAWLSGERIDVAEIALPPGTVTGGEIQDAAAVTDALKELWSTHKPPTKAVVVGLANQDIVTRPVTMPALSHGDLRSALVYELADMVPFSIEDATFDILAMTNDDAAVATVDDGGPDHIDLLAVVALSSTVREVMTIVKDAGLQLVAVDSTPLALVRSAGRTDVETHAVVHLGTDSLLLTVHHRGVVQFCRSVVTQQSSNLSGEIENELVFIEQFRRRAAGAEGLTTSADVRDHPLVAAIRGTLEYAGSQRGARPVDAVSLVGDNERCVDTVDPLSRALGVPVQVVDPLDRLAANGVESIGWGTPFAGAAGLALVAGPDVPGPRRIDLIPKSSTGSPGARALALKVGASALATAAVLALVSFLFGPSVGDAERRAVDAERGAAAAASQLDQLADVRADVRDTKLLERRVAAVGEQQIDWGRLTNEIAIAAPADVSIVSISGEGPDPRAKRKSWGTMQISAQAPNQTTISSWMRALGSVRGLSDAWLSGASTGGGRGELGSGFTSFTLTVDLTEDAGVPALPTTEVAR